jgi:hypothetical protein
LKKGEGKMFLRAGEGKGGAIIGTKETYLPLFKGADDKQIVHPVPTF